MNAFLFASFVGIFVSSLLCNAEETAAEQVARVAAESEKAKKSEYAKKYDAAIDKLEAKYPECFDEKTPFYKAYSPRFDDVIQSKDAVTLDPEWAFHLAEKVAQQLAANGVPIIIKELPEGGDAIRVAAQKNQLGFEQNRATNIAKEEVAPSATKFEETLQRLANEKRKAGDAYEQEPANNQPQPAAQPQSEIQQYLDAVRRGEAGVNPKDQTAARSGDPHAAARIRHQMAGNQITRRLNAGSITPEQASIERAAASASYQQELDTIEQQKLLEEMRRQNEALERMNRELEQRRYQRR